MPLVRHSVSVVFHVDKLRILRKAWMLVSRKDAKKDGTNVANRTFASVCKSAEFSQQRVQNVCCRTAESGVVSAGAARLAAAVTAGATTTVEVEAGAPAAAAAAQGAAGTHATNGLAAARKAAQQGPTHPSRKCGERGSLQYNCSQMDTSGANPAHPLAELPSLSSF